MLARKGPRESRASQPKRRPRKRRRFWRCSLEELPGVWGTECRESWQRNKGGLTRSKAHILRDSWYKHVNAKSGGTPREKSEGVTVLAIIETTQLDGREGPLLQPSQSWEVSDGACPKGPIPPVPQITTTPAKAMPGGQGVIGRLFRPESVAGRGRERATRDLACHGKKVVGKPCEGKPHARFEVAGGGNQGGERHPAPGATP